MVKSEGSKKFDELKRINKDANRAALKINKALAEQQRQDGSDSQFILVNC